MQAATVPLPSPELDRSGGRRRPTLVIVDAGFEASIVAFDTSFRPQIGDRFWHAGRVWEVVGWRAPARAFVARFAGRMA